MVAFSIFWRNIYRYGIFYLVWFVLSYCFLYFLWKKKIFHKYTHLQNVLSNDLDSLFIVLILGVLIGWRLWHIFIYWFQHYIWNRTEAFQIRKWWMSFIWWFIWILIWTCVFCRKKKMKRDEFVILLDLFACIWPLCLAFWRLGNFLNQELFWVIFNNPFWRSNSTIENLTSLWFLHIYQNIWPELRINTNLLSVIFEWITLFIVLQSICRTQIQRKKRKIWKTSMIFLLRYSIVRFILEYLRQDSQFEFIWPFSKSQRFFLFAIIWGIIWTIFMIRKRKENLNKA